jgi:hypothetical protein
MSGKKKTRCKKKIPTSFRFDRPGRFLTAFFIHAILFAMSDDQLINMRRKKSYA